MTRPLSFLDLTPIESGSTSGQALQNSLTLATLADRLGYHRLWFAEHHNTTGLASGTPEIMIAHIASKTTHLRVGSGGVMLPNHSPLRIIEAFRLLEALHPGRIDLGLGRAPGTDTLTAFAMRRSREAMTGEDYPSQLAELLAYDDHDFPDDHPFREIKAVPHDVKMPPLWLLGSSDFSAQLAAGAGLGFAFAAHINFPGAIPALRTYRETFSPSSRYPEPQSILTVSVTVGETPEHARELSLVNDLFLVRLRTGQHLSYPTLEEARNHQYSPAERAILASRTMNYIAGDAASVRQQVEVLAERAQADEVMITTTLPGLEDRKRTLIQMAREFGLTERPAVATVPDAVAV
jgi:luciferase family oxidoreductase group 1